MKFLDYLNEYDNPWVSERLDIIKKMAKMIKQDCKPFLNEAHYTPFYRGSQTVVVETFVKLKSRTDRIPKDTPLWMHEILDRAFKKRFGWNVRSEGIFTQTNSLLAAAYGTPQMFFPIGKYKYVWAPRVKDLFDELSTNTWFSNVGHVDDIDRDSALSWMHGIHEWVRFKKPVTKDLSTVEIVENVIDAIVDTYIPDNLEYAGKKECEVAFKCENYYLVNIAYGSEVRRILFS